MKDLNISVIRYLFQSQKGRNCCPFRT